MGKRILKIKVWDGEKELYSEEVPAGNISEKKIEELLKALVVKYSLEGREIVNAYLKKNTKRFHDYFGFRSKVEGRKYIYYCGDNPHATAVVSLPEE